MADSPPCAACQGNRFEKFRDGIRDYEYGLPHVIPLVRCADCRLIRHDPLPELEILPSFYPDDYLVYNQSFKQGSTSLFVLLKRVLHETRARRVVSLIGRRGRVLDVGCANGAFLRSLKPLGDYELHGIDIKNTGVDFAALGVEFHQGCLETIDYSEDSFDAVILDNLIEHVPAPCLFMDKVRAVLKPGGYVFGTTPNHDSLDRLAFGPYWGGYHMPRHIHIFNANNLRLLLENAGFIDIVMPATPNAGDWAVSLQNVLRRKGGKSRRYRRGWYFPLVGLALSPLAYLTSFFKANGVMDFICRKRAR